MVALIVVAVEGKTAVITPLPAEFVAEAPETVNWFWVTPDNVYPAVAEIVMVAVYAVPARNVLGLVFHVTEPV